MTEGKNDEELARAIPLKPISDIGAMLGVPEHALTPIGRYKAKIDPTLASSSTSPPKSKLILVTAMTPTVGGEGKTTVAISLGDGLNRLGKRAVICIREPSLGPCFGVKGGATGGGASQVVPRDEINLHFTGDFHAVASANNLLAALVDNHLYHGALPSLDARRITWRRTIDMNDRALREVVVGLGGASNGYVRADGFDIVPGSEVMAILSLARNRAELTDRLARIVVGYTHRREPVLASDLHAEGAMSALLKDAFAPNLVQTLEHNPVLIHAGPFANIAHGCNSVIATETALALGDYVVTEAGFGADLGAEKFFDIKCRQAGLTPAMAVVVATIRSLKAHGGADPNAIQAEDADAVVRGLPNLLHHIAIVKTFGLPAVVAINRYAEDSDAELAAVTDALHACGTTAVVSDHWANSGKGAEKVAEEVVALTNEEPNGAGFSLLYPNEMSLIDKVETIATSVYGADGIDVSDVVRRDFARLQAAGYGHLPICLAKTPQSLSTNPRLLGVPKHFSIPIRELRLAAGAGFVVALAGNISTMPGLPSRPASRDLFVNANGQIEGLK